MRKISTTLLLGAALTGPAYALTSADLDSGLTAIDLVRALIGGNNVTFSNVRYTGANAAAGTFGGGNASGLGMDAGVLLSSGRVADAAGPNTSTGKSTQHNSAGDSQLDGMAGAATRDAAVLEFDFVPQGNTLTIKYAFASEEYNEFVGSAFNDVFAFFLDGQNIALLPNTLEVVATNTVNATRHAELFTNNELSAGAPHALQFDGFTGVLEARAAVTPGATHHIKLAIADVNDANFDSAVFIQAGSFGTLGQTAQGGTHNIPTLSEWAMIVLSGLLMLFGMRGLRRRSA